MGIVKRQSIKATIIQYVGMMVGYLNVGVLFPALLTTTQFGLYSFLITSSRLLMPFTQLGITNIIVRFRPYFRGNDIHHRRFVWFIIVVPLIGFLGVFLLLFLIKTPLLTRLYSDEPLIQQYYYLIIPITLFLSLIGVWSAYSRSSYRIVVPALLEKVLLRLILAGLLVLMYFSIIRFSGVLNWFVIGHAFIFLVLLIYVGRITTLKFAAKGKWASASLKREMYTFGSLSVLTSIGNEIVMGIDVIMLSAMRGLSDTGIYNLAFFIGTIIDMPMRSIGQISSPLIAKAWKDGKKSIIQDLYAKSSINLIIVGTAVFLLIWTNADNLFQIIPNGTRYVEGKWVILFIGLGKVFSMALGNNSEIIANSKYYYFNLISLVMLGVVAIGTNLILIPIMGIKGAAIASAISLILYNSTKYLFIWIKFGLQPFSRKTIVAIGIAILAWLVAWAMPYMGNEWLDLLVRCTLILAVYSPLVILFNVSDEISEIFVHLRNRFRL